MAVRFDASGEHYTGSSPGIPGTVGTVTAWVYLDVDPPTQCGLVTLNASGGNNTIVTDPGPFLFGQSNNGSSFPTLSFPSATTGAWFGVGMSWDGPSAAWVKVSADGTVLETYTSSSWLPPDSPSGMTLGTHYYSLSTRWFRGRLAAVKLWDARLTQTEVEAELTQFAPLRTAGLQRYYPFHVAEQTDYSGNGHTLSGGSGASTVADPPIPDTVTVTPVVDAGADTTIRVDQQFVRTATEDDGGEPIRSRAWTVESGPDQVGATLSMTATVEWAPTVVGTYVLRYAATNDDVTGSDDVTVTVTAAPPSVDAGADTVATVDQVFTRTAIEDDGGATITARKWEIVSGPT